MSFSIAQKQHVKDSGRFSNSGNDSLCKQTSDEETRVVPRNRLLILQSLSFRNRPVGKTSVKTMSELSSYVALKNLVSKTTSHSHTLVCRGAHHTLLTQPHSQAPRNCLRRRPPSLCLQYVVSAHRDDEVRLTKLHFRSFKSYYHINVIGNMSLVTSCSITDKKQKSFASVESDSLRPHGQ